MYWHILVAITCFIICAPAHAAQRSPEVDILENAIVTWLAGDDGKALPELATLAENGNRDARILLGRIATRSQSNWLKALDRDKRNKLLRAPGGLSGHSWLGILADAGDVHALALHTAFRPPFEFVKIQALIEHGEVETAMRVALRFINHGGIQAEFAALPQAFGRDGAYTAYLPLIHHGVIKSFRLKGTKSDPAIWTPDAMLMYGAFAERTGERVDEPLKSWLAIMSGDAIGGDPDDATLVGGIIDRLPSTHRNLRAVRRFCEATCPGQRLQCLATVTVLHRSGFNGLWAYSSPTNMVVDPERYYQSRRAITEVRSGLIDRMSDRAPVDSTTKWTDALQCLRLPE